jgi:hypothetical protein
MVCSKCGTFLDDGLKFCSECGANLGDPDDWAGSTPKKPSKYQKPEYEESWDGEYSPSPAKKPAARRHTEHQYEPQEPQRIIIEHSRKKGDDISTSFGRAFGDTIGTKAGGCVWSLMIIALIIIVIIIIGFSLK